MFAAPTSSPMSTMFPPQERREAAVFRGVGLPATNQVACFRAIPSGRANTGAVIKSCPAEW